MARAPQVLLLDDGELDDVQQMLDQGGVSYGRIRGGAIAPNTPPPTRLLVTTPRRVNVVNLPRAAGLEGDGVMRIVVTNEDSPTLRARLREVGFDYLVRRPVHAEALRLLLFHCIYTGEERRREPRIPVGFEVSFRTGLLPRRATLADLSTRGARLVSRWPLEPGKRITVTVPQRVGIPDSITIKGRVLRMSLDESDGDTPYSAAVAFEEMPAETRQELEWILEERARGPATLGAGGKPAAEQSTRDGASDDAVPQLDPPETRADDLLHGVSVDVDVRLEVAEDALPEVPPEAAQALLEPPPEPAPAEETEPLAPSTSFEPLPPVGKPAAAAGDSPAGKRAQKLGPLGNEDTQPLAGLDESASTAANERRGAPRRSYERRVPAFGDRAMRVLVARDLSMFGMRIEQEPSLELGDRLHLAIYGSAQEEPFLVWATVERIDGTEAMYLRFDELHPVIGSQLEAVVAGLPSVESLHDDEAAAMGTVVTEILNH